MPPEAQDTTVRIGADINKPYSVARYNIRPQPLRELDLGDEGFSVFNLVKENKHCGNNEDEILHIGKRMTEKQKNVNQNCQSDSRTKRSRVEKENS